MNRRAFLTGAAATAASVFALSGRARATANQWLVQAAQKLPSPPGTPYPLVALPTKAPMGQVYDLPPNYETPMQHLIGTKNYPMTDNEYYYVRYREAAPLMINRADFRLKISGDAVTTPMELTLDDLQQFPSVTTAAVGECSGLGRGLLRPMVPGLPWTKGDFGCAEWTGASLKAILEHVGADPNAEQITFRSGANTISRNKPDYIRAYKPESVLTQDAMLAYQMNGVAPNFWNGYPLRLVVPGTYAPSWVKQVVEIEVRTTADPGEWSGREIGKGLLKTCSLITNPPDGTEVAVGERIDIKGVAWDHGQGIERVEISVDEGKTWEAAELEEPVGTYAWRLFNHTVEVEQPGHLRVCSRATSADGATQPFAVPQEVFDNSGRGNNAADTFALILVGK